MQMTEPRRWRFTGPEMEGPIARWYARVRGSKSQLDAYREQVSQITAGLPAGARVLEVAFGPGYQAIEMARLGFHVTGLDISRTFVEIATEYTEGALPAETTDLVEQHLVMCDWCRDYLDQLEATVDAVGGLEPERPPKALLDDLLVAFRSRCWEST